MNDRTAMSQLPRLAQAIHLWPISQVRPYDRNPKTHPASQVSELAAALIEHGFLKPLIVDETGELLAGHGLLLAARRLHLEQVPVVVHAGLTAEQKRAYRIADNRLAEKSEWNDEVLARELTDLKAAGYETFLTGFSDEELRELEESLEETEPGATAGTSKRLSYTILFDDAEQHANWLAFVESVKQRPAWSQLTVAGKLAAHAREVLEGR